MNQSDNLQAIDGLQRQLIALGHGEQFGTVEELATMLVNAAPAHALYFADRCSMIAQNFERNRPDSAKPYLIQVAAILKAERELVAATIRQSVAA